VSDTGPGIPSELGDTIFEPFKRDYSSTNKPGTGLGLSISRQLAIAMNGTLGIDPTVARGACFVLRVPLRSATSTPISDESSTAPSDPPLSILVAEDTPANQFVLRLMLNRLGHSVHTVNDGQAAVEAFAALKFDLVLLDVQMPVMDGYTAARTIRASGETGRAVPIIALTAFTQDSDRDAAFSAGVNAFITKPIRSQELISTIQRVCSPPSPATADRKPPRTD
jgi:CheY-like chemotaxis protein